MRIFPVLLALLLMPLAAVASAGAGREISAPEAIKTAKDAIRQSVPIPENTPFIVVLHRLRPSHEFVVQAEVEMPNGYWGYTPRPQAIVNGDTGQAIVHIWRDDAPGEQLPPPEEIARRFLMHPDGLPQDPEKAIHLTARWLDKHRDRETEDVDLDNAYDRFALAYHESRAPERLLDALAREAGLTSNARALYAIHRQMARYYTRRKNYDAAIAEWLEAKQSIKPRLGTGAYFETHDALTLLEIGTLYLQAGDARRAAKWLDAYCATDYGQKNCAEATNLLGGIYERAGDLKNAAAAYRRFLETPEPESGNAFALEQIKNGFRTKLELVEEAMKEEADQAGATTQPVK